MNDQSPPKRVTRARAAAKTTDTAPKTTKIATAASKAKTTRSAPTTKRKTRADDIHEDEEQLDPETIIEPEPKPTRGRARKVVKPEPELEMEEEAPAPVKATRGRPKKVVVETPASEPTRSTRGRAKKVDVPEEQSGAVVEEPPKRAPRARAAPKAAPKKTVTFEEPDKENIVPQEINAKGKPETGLRAKPVRKPAATTTRATRGRAKTLAEEKPERQSPLSPKKTTQIATAKESVSEDELASNEKTPMKPLSKSPMKPPGSLFGTAKKLDFSSSINVNRVTTQDLSGSVMGSPARRPLQSPFKESMKASPQKVPLGGSMLQSPFKPSFPAPKTAAANSPFKASLLGSPARRPQSPTKVAENGSPSRSTTSIFNATPKASTFKISRFTTPRALTKSDAQPGQMLPPSARGTLSTGSPGASANDTDSTLAIQPSLSFSGRLSSIMPRDVDPSFTTSESIVEEATEMSIIPEAEPLAETVVVDDPAHSIVVEDPMDSQSTTPPASPPRHSTGAFGLRQEDENPFQDSDSEDELASGSPRFSPAPLTGFQNISREMSASPATPTPFSGMTKTPRTVTTQRSVRQQKIGFTPLAAQLTNWMADSPEKSDSGSDGERTPVAQRSFAPVEPSPAKSTFFEDEMVVRDELVAAPEPASVESDIIQENFEAVEPDEEDLALAHEADEMSLLEPDEILNHVSEELFAPESTETPAEPALSEASQEYVISYSPTKSTARVTFKEQPLDVVMQDIIATPSKPEMTTWSTMGTPARTPRRDLNNALLKGAVVFVDVHTTEGADASTLFTELLTQMGARCVKRWDWNGNGDESSNKIGITHVVFKDGGKRTLEKVKETNGVVSCVGVGWVLDCERGNKWLDEAPYLVDTAMVPRGGHRRRKSMEPRALANLNGTLVPSTPGRMSMSPTKEFLSLPDTPGLNFSSKKGRRETVEWVRSPNSSTPEAEPHDQTLLLSPVPATPAPETLSSMYTEAGLYGNEAETPVGQTPYFLHNEQLVQKTAPAGRRCVDREQGEQGLGFEGGKGYLGSGGEMGWLEEKKDESVMVRLMAARRKSLQFAPKVGSPLARGELF
ncbi:putative Microcephalin [Hyaloscypha sp. PMI_1271]|nr:putative Microcephalin [Hyaloscypha sp. PMI_1271]